MDRLPNAPTTLVELVEVDLRRPAHLIIKVQDECDPQWRFATPSGDWIIAPTLPYEPQQRL